MLNNSLIRLDIDKNIKQIHIIKNKPTIIPVQQIIIKNNKYDLYEVNKFDKFDIKQTYTRKNNYYWSSNIPNGLLIIDYDLTITKVYIENNVKKEGISKLAYIIFDIAKKMGFDIAIASRKDLNSDNIGNVTKNLRKMGICGKVTHNEYEKEPYIQFERTDKSRHMIKILQYAIDIRGISKDNIVFFDNAHQNFEFFNPQHSEYKGQEHYTRKLIEYFSDIRKFNKDYSDKYLKFIKENPNILLSVKTFLVDRKLNQEMTKYYTDEGYRKILRKHGPIYTSILRYVGDGFTEYDFIQNSIDNSWPTNLSVDKMIGRYLKMLLKGKVVNHSPEKYDIFKSFV